jgi:hypothetical protein
VAQVILGAPPAPTRASRAGGPAGGLGMARPAVADCVRSAPGQVPLTAADAFLATFLAVFLTGAAALRAACAAAHSLVV